MAVSRPSHFDQRAAASAFGLLGRHGDGEGFGGDARRVHRAPARLDIVTTIPPVMRGRQIVAGYVVVSVTDIKPAHDSVERLPIIPWNRCP